MVVFDLSEIESLANTKTWKIDACKNATDPLVFLVGTKKDLVVSYSLFLEKNVLVNDHVTIQYQLKKHCRF